MFMNENTKTQNFQVLRDGQLDKDLTIQPPTFTEALQTAVKTRLTRFTGELVLQAQMASFDALHKTNYRSIRNNLKREAKNKAFEAKIGLVRK